MERVTQLEINERAAWEIHALLDLTKPIRSDAVKHSSRMNGTRYTSWSAMTQLESEEKLHRVLEALFKVDDNQVVSVKWLSTDVSRWRNGKRNEAGRAHCASETST